MTISCTADQQGLETLDQELPSFLAKLEQFEKKADIDLI